MKYSKEEEQLRVVMDNIHKSNNAVWSPFLFSHYFNDELFNCMVGKKNRPRETPCDKEHVAAIKPNR